MVTIHIECIKLKPFHRCTILGARKNSKLFQSRTVYLLKYIPYGGYITKEI